MIAIGLAVVGLVVLALRPGSAVTVVDDTPVPDPPDDGTAIVTQLRAPGGFAPFGLQIIDPTHRVTVQFLSGPDCASLVESGDPWPTPHAECTGPDGITGAVAGLGITQTGASLVGVSITVGRDCYEQVEVGTAWPPGVEECAGG
jgi:hypothetical protein